MASLESDQGSTADNVDMPLAKGDTQRVFSDLAALASFGNDLVADVSEFLASGKAGSEYFSDLADRLDPSGYLNEPVSNATPSDSNLRSDESQPVLFGDAYADQPGPADAGDEGQLEKGEADLLLSTEAVLSSSDNLSRNAGELLAATEGAEYHAINEPFDLSNVDILHVVAHGAILEHSDPSSLKQFGIELMYNEEQVEVYDASQFADYLRENGFKGSEVHLVACNLAQGSDEGMSFAEELHRELNVKVAAYDQQVVVDRPYYGLLAEDAKVLLPTWVDVPFTDRDLSFVGPWSSEAEPIVFGGNNDEHDDDFER